MCLSEKNVLQLFSDAFSKHDFDVGLCRDYLFSIKCQPNISLSLPSRRIPMHLKKSVDNMIKNLLANDIIEESDSPYNSPLVIVPKKDGSIRLCVDFRELNRQTIRDSFHIPDASEIFDQLGGNRFYSTIDLAKGYHQVLMDKHSQWLTAFSSGNSHYHFKRLPFGLCSAPACFQNILQKILMPELGKSCCVYIDDIIIFGATKKQHDENFVRVIKLLKDSGMKISPKKFVFSKPSVKFLGHVISEEGISTDPEKVKCIKEWPKPVIMRDLTKFIGFVNYYRKFVPNFVHIIAPLEDVSIKAKTARRNKIEWTVEMEKSFEELKKVLMKTPILHCPKQENKFILDTDASKYGIGAVLSQVDSAGVERVIYFASNKLSTAEQNYCATRRELLAVVRYVDFFYHYLIGKKFIIRTDHKSLKWLLNWKTPTTAQYFSWISKLQLFDFEIEYREGIKHINADALSRLEYCKRCKTTHINNISVSCPPNEAQIIQNHIANKTSPAANDHKQVWKLWKLRERLILKDGKLFLKNDGNLFHVLSRQEAKTILIRLHCLLCHVGASNLHAMFSRQYFAINSKEICQNVTGSCFICLQRKATHPGTIEKSSLACTDVFQKVFMDVAGPLPEYNGFKYILVIMDGFSSHTALVPLRQVSGATISSEIFKKWISVFGAPSILHSDNATYFKSEEVKQVCERFEIQRSFSSPYYPQGNGKVERMIYTVKDMIFCSMRQSSKSWPSLLPEIEMSLNTIVRYSTGISPYEIVFGKSMRIGKAIDFKFLNLSDSQIREITKKLFPVENYKVPTETIKLGQYVMFKILPIEKSIFKPRFMGPFKVIQIKASGKVIVGENIEGKVVTRSIHHVKPMKHFSSYPVYLKKPFYQKVSHTNSAPSKSQNHEPAPPPPRYPTRERHPVSRYGFS